ncbi:hypothetical protein CO134_01685 [Candidatus Kuenenbacteria bacterium CG_4_9_14_3_um_filter_39_14]|uniref:Polymerase/histidinol phosphatase N-terminal domain-containing protein n=6 Tax=Candidatus Kueneniibacteriota TaxID=1752740 RepID=A0A2M7IM58_9BACT|nr:PHP domain-containing protein [Candidatus Kuenenbacteria bacterium]OIP55276.1 MAG: hypothetical protein AUK13_02990 [Candidatus Kuenenbacteria bacterium CG2_30_39_24]PIP28747.1 MAG: hypothetical protein COX28_03075 [Candidatus Kuenenbacteria bacterium CG23_combo_of_CG06-09_8_20_14_all_39_39]PIW95884.1 MAG: hypothetical protein COZ84_01105 [Candidatus Kuenenbacteria bacterium CG_4_8_14_3_um_filter_39_15]PIX92281.1 MAG: hypothetical protein COZ26_02645 [Candidatus Kuenenbacteria bacterium CG_4
MYVDLHCHTTASDGKLTPTQLIQKAKRLDFSWLAKVDHDSAYLTDEFLLAGKKYKINAIAGIEISSRYKNKSIHVIGLGINHASQAIIAYAKSKTIARKIRGLKMVKKLEKNGWHIKKSELKRQLVARPHVALAVINHPKNKKRLLAEFGQMPNFSTFITAYIAPGKPGFVPKTFYISPAAAIKLIHSAGGLAIIGHPCSKTKEFSYSQAHLKELITKFKFDGLEVYSHDHNQAEIKYLKKLALKYNLLMSAGSDYHGYDKITPLGICNNGRYATQKMCQEIISRLT